jgi:tRNA pseudouridine38-40 synthase
LRAASTASAMVTKLTLEYDGTGFVGWARQPGERSVEGELQRALRTVLGECDADAEPLRLSVAGRTDRGVHAWGQVASYAHEPVDPLRLNGLLDDDVAVLAAEPAPPAFDARRDATSRTYCYRVLARRTRSVFERGRVYWWRGRLDREALAECAEALLGRHDFRAFTPSETEHSRFQRDVLGAEWRADGDLLEFWIEADTFMRHMNRVLVGTMLDVGSGLSSVEEFRRLLDGGTRAQAGRTAPAHGLALAHVSYARENRLSPRSQDDATARAAPEAGPAIGGRSGPYAG